MVGDFFWIWLERGAAIIAIATVYVAIIRKFIPRCSRKKYYLVGVLSGAALLIAIMPVYYVPLEEANNTLVQNAYNKMAVGYQIDIEKIVVEPYEVVPGSVITITSKISNMAGEKYEAWIGATAITSAGTAISSQNEDVAFVLDAHSTRIIVRTLRIPPRTPVGMCSLDINIWLGQRGCPEFSTKLTGRSVERAFSVHVP